MTSAETRKCSVALGVVVGLLVGVFLFCPCNGLLPSSVRMAIDSRFVDSIVTTRPFDRSLWRRGTATQRVGMAQDLVDKKTLVGMKRAEVVELLGPPDVDEPRVDGMRWRLGKEEGGLFDNTVWLELTIETDGTVSSAGIGADGF